MSEADIRRERDERQAAQRRLIPFCKYMWDGFETRPYRELIAGALERLEWRNESTGESDITRLMIMSPPQYGKSTIVSQMFPAWYMGRHPDDSLILCSYGVELATSHSYMARGYVTSPAYRAVFGDLSAYDVPVEISDKASATKQWRLKNHRGKMLAAGVGSGITGHSSNLLLIDDPLRDAEDADSEILRQRQIEWYRGSAVTRLAPNGKICICMTRWHQADLMGWLLEEQANGGDKWHVLRLPALAESPEQIRNWCQRHHVDPEHYLVADTVGQRRAA